MHYFQKFTRSCLLTLIVVLTPALVSAEENKPKQYPLDFTFDETSVTTGEYPRSYAEALEPATKAVVTVFTRRLVRQSTGSNQREQMEDMLRRQFGIPIPPRRTPDGEPQQEVERMLPSGMGSGTLVSPDGFILTNHHVITGRRGQAADEVVVQLPDGREFDAEVIGSDAQTDIALLKIDATDLPFLTVADSEKLRVGDVVFAVGNPLGVGLTVTSGIVSAVGRSDLGILGYDSYESFIQTDASINVGNSGGPLVDAKGRLVGINTAILSRTGGNIGLGFAIPANLATAVSTSLNETGEVRRGFLGVGIESLNRDLAEGFGLPNTKGALVNQVHEGLPAEKAGIQHGDVILAVGNSKVDSAADLRYLISRIAPGSTVEITLMRGGEIITLPVALGDRDALMADRGDSPAAARTPLFRGLTFTPLNDELRQQYSIPETIQGLVLTQIAPDSPYADRMRPGMVLVELNQNPVTTLEDARKVLRKDAVNILWIYFNDRYAYLSLK
jgi:serine protease Do